MAVLVVADLISIPLGHFKYESTRIRGFLNRFVEIQINETTEPQFEIAWDPDDKEVQPCPHFV